MTENLEGTLNPMVDDNAAKIDEKEKKKEDVVEDYEEFPADPATPAFSLKPTLIVIFSALVGLGIGIGLSDGRGDEEVISWVKLPGDLFIRALKCIVLPLVFVNIILAVVDMIRAGKASAVGWKTIGLYTLTTLLASIEGLIFVLIFQDRFSEQTTTQVEVDPVIQIQCPEGNNTYLGLNVNDTLGCFTKESAEVNFIVDNSNGFLLEAGDSGVADDISFSKTLQDGIFRKLISDNIVNEFIIANFVGIIVFAIVFGAASQALKRQPTVVIELLEELNRIFLQIIDWIIFLTPIAVLSLIAGNLGGQTNLSTVFIDIGFLIASTLTAMACHFFIVYPMLFLIFVRQNPFAYYKFLIPAQTFAFASASSAATLPISLECVASTKQVPASINNFVLSMGATLNMDGGGIYFPTAIVFLAIASGLRDQLNASTYFLIILLSTVGSAGTAPVPSASLVLIITAFNTVFDTVGTPEAFGLILTIDWLMDRFRTLLNVTGDTVMARVITAVAKVSFEDDVLENEAIAGEDFE